MGTRRDFETGQVLDRRYTLVERIGSGAVGSVWRAHDAQRGHHVALKLIVPMDSEGRVSRTKIGRFMREARAMARLRSPHVVRVYDHGALQRDPEDEASLSSGVHAPPAASSSSPGTPAIEVVYISMEVLIGEPLRALLKRRKTVDPATVLRMLRHVGRAVDFAHQRGIVHRDLKPANIFLCDEDHGRFVAKVLDFGMVKSLGMPLATLDLVKTELGRPIGTPYYMSPEQARGQSNVDHRTDLWAMGIIAYECLVGERPFKGKSLAKVFTEIAAGAVPVPSQHATVPRGFDAWFRRAVARDIQKRFQSVRTLLDELEEVLGPPSGHTVAGLRPDKLGVTVATVSDLEVPPSTAAQEPSLTDRTLRRAPKSAGASFIGREREFEQMDEAVTSHCRVLTLQGFAGVGKARTAREYGRRAADKFPGGVWLSSLTDVTDADGMWLAFATVLGVHLGEGEPSARIGRALAGLGQALFVIENVDGVRAHLAATLTQWLAAAPQALFIVTSRRALALPTERVIRVHALPFPPDDSIASLSDTKRWAATELLLRRAISFNRRLLGQQSYAPSLGQLAWRVQGNALGLELLAAQTGTHDPSDMVARLGSTLVHATGTTIIQPDAVLQGMIEWVLDGLPPHERSALSQLAAFRRGFTAAAAEQVVDLSTWDDAPPVASLMRKFALRSLLQRGTDLTGEERFSLHPVLLRVVREKAFGEDGAPGWLSADEQRALQIRHGRYFAQLGAPEAIEALERRGGSLRRNRLMAEVENLRVAMGEAAERRDGDVAAACALALAAIDRLMGRHSAAAKRLVAPVGVSETPPDARVRCLLTQCRALLADGRAEAAVRGLERLRAVLYEVPEGSLDRASAEADALALRATIDRHRGELPGAMQHILAARQVAADRGDRLRVAEADLLRGRWQREGGDPTAAKQVLQQARVAFEEVGATARLAEVLEELGHGYAAAGQREAAESAFEEALTRYRELGDRYREASIIGELGDRALDVGDLDQALSQLSLAVGRARELGAADVESRYLAATASTLQLLGREEDAWKRLVQAEQLLRFESDHARAELVGVLCRRAQMEERRQAFDDARRSVREAESLLEDLTMPVGPRIVPTLHDLKRRLQA